MNISTKDTLDDARLVDSQDSGENVRVGTVKRSKTGPKSGFQAQLNDVVSTLPAKLDGFISGLTSLAGARTKKPVSTGIPTPQDHLEPDKTNQHDNAESQKPKFKLGRARRSDLQDLYKTNASFADLLPWVEYLPDSKQFLFEDGVSRMSVFNVEPIPTEGRSQEMLKETSEKLARVISDTFPEEDRDPWTVQFFLNTEPSLEQHMNDVRSTASDNDMDSQYTEDYLEQYSQHLANVAAEKGYFFDQETTESVWRGQMMMIRIVIYRRYFRSRPSGNTEHEMEQMASRLSTSLRAAGISTSLCDGADFYRWMLIWFNPKPPVYDGDIRKTLENIPYPSDKDPVPGNDLAEMVLLDAPRADRKTGYWHFNDLPHTVVQIGKIMKPPAHGALSGEMRLQQQLYALTDKLPIGAIVSMTIFILPQDVITNRIKLIADRAVGDTAESGITRSEAANVLEKQARNDKLFPFEAAIYVRGNNERDLKTQIQQVKSHVESLGLRTLNGAEDPIALDNYIKNLPGVQVEALDRKARQRARLAFSSHISSLAPLYGRARGTGNPGLLFFNRSGEPITFNPLSKYDRRKNAHMLVLGPTGAGKSACLVHLMMSLGALNNPKYYIIEAGNSFGLFGDHARDMGKTVHKVKLSMGSNVSIPPFADLTKVIEAEEKLDLEAIGSSDEDLMDSFSEDDDEDDDEEVRDYLGEAQIMAVLMATGGEQKELDNLTRSLKGKIKIALKNAAREVYDRPPNEGKTVLPEDVARHLDLVASDPNNVQQKQEIENLAASIRLFTDGLNGNLFNRQGEAWPDADVTIIDLAQSAARGYEDTLAVAYTSLIQHINAEVEKNQFEQRMTVVLTDEAHLILKNQLLMPYVVSIVKMWRKLGAWYWLGTQNVADFPDSGKVLLNMIEWWMCLNMPADEVEQIARFKTLSEDEKAMMLSCRKAPAKYTEGVVLSEQMKMLFRNVPPPIALALAMTEKDEKVDRQKLMDKHGITEVQAAYKIAETIGTNRERALKPT